LFGLTATASFDVLADVERELSGEGAFVLDADTIVRFENTNRLELQYKVEKVDVEFDQDTNRYDEHNELDPALPKPVNLFGANNSKAFQNTKNRFLTTVIQGIPKHINELQTLKATDLIKKTFIFNSTKVKTYPSTEDYYKDFREYNLQTIIENV
jgi:hypothetical protein